LFDDNFDLIKNNFRTNILPYIREPDMRVDAIELLNVFFGKLMERIEHTKNMKALESITEGLSSGNIKDEKLTEEQKNVIIKQGTFFLLKEKFKMTALDEKLTSIPLDSEQIGILMRKLALYLDMKPSVMELVDGLYGDYDKRGHI
ncbi:MAG: hypothetical protein V1900_01915, partial [Candidatus Aenigmatarchaeota archaeon]